MHPVRGPWRPGRPFAPTEQASADPTPEPEPIVVGSQRRNQPRGPGGPGRVFVPTRQATADSIGDVAIAAGSYWGPHFPPPGSLSAWDGHFPELASDGGFGPVGAATFALLLESGVTVTYAWRTGLFKSYSGLERRSNIVDDPAQRYEGSAMLVGADTRAARSRLARYAAMGRSFLLGLPYEGISVSARSTTATVPVYTTAFSDWAIPGGRVIVRHKDYGDAEGIIQSVAADSLVLDTAPGDPVRPGGVVMPAMAVYLDPTQGFDRYPTKAERWQIRARSAVAGFASPGGRASLSLASPTTASPALQSATIYARTAGAAGNGISVRFIDDGSTLGTLEENTSAKTVIIHFDATSTPAGRITTLLASSSLVYITGASGITAIGFAAAFGPTSLAAVTDPTIAPVGIGAIVNTFAGRPLWDRRIQVEGTAPDSMQSMAQAEDFGGLPFNAGTANVPDWGRHLMMSRPIGAEFQWLKRFLDTVKGRWRTFWFATWREDLIPVSSGAGTLTVEAGENSGDFFAWWPAQQQYLQIHQADDTLTYVRVSAAVQVGSSITLTILDENGNPATLSGSAIEMVSWLERVRLESDEIPIQFHGWNFTLSTTARVVQQ